MGDAHLPPRLSLGDRGGLCSNILNCAIFFCTLSVREKGKKHLNHPALGKKQRAARAVGQGRAQGVLMLVLVSRSEGERDPAWAGTAEELQQSRFLQRTGNQSPAFSF